MDGPHTHTCATPTCRRTWACSTLVRCQTERAAKVNKAGPWCGVCLHVEMAKRYARAFGIELQVAWPPPPIKE
jgi:hypothetical protein